MINKNILIICANNLKKAPRFLMEVEALKSDYNLIAAGLNSQTNNNYEFINLEIKNEVKIPNVNFHFKYPFLLRKIVSFFIRIIYINQLYQLKNQKKIKEKKEFDILKNTSFDLIIVHHIWHLSLAVKLAKLKNTKIVFNAHEYYPLEFDNDKKWMQLNHEEYTNICKKYLPFVAICFCVGNIIAEKYKKEFKLKSIVIQNSKSFYNLIPKNIEKNTIKLIHHGAVIPSRKIELMIDMMDYLNDNYHLTLILIPSGDKNYYNFIIEKALKHPRISIKEPVDIEQIPLVLNNFDIGVFILPHTNYNYKNALPNKFFEFIQARLMIAIGPSPEMAELVDKYHLGIIADDFEPITIANKIKNLSFDQIMEFKKQSHSFAKELSDEKTKELIKATIKSLI